MPLIIPLKHGFQIKIPLFLLKIKEKGGFKALKRRKAGSTSLTSLVSLALNATLSHALLSLDKFTDPGGLNKRKFGVSRKRFLTFFSNGSGYQHLRHSSIGQNRPGYRPGQSTSQRPKHRRTSHR